MLVTTRWSHHPGKRHVNEEEAPTSRRTMRARAVPEGIRGRRGCNAYDLARCLGQSDLGKAFDAVNAAGETADAGGPEVGA